MFGFCIFISRFSCRWVVGWLLVIVQADVCGFWSFPRLSPLYQPPNRLVRFLKKCEEENKAAFCVGLGSMPVLGLVKVSLTNIYISSLHTNLRISFFTLFSKNTFFLPQANNLSAYDFSTTYHVVLMVWVWRGINDVNIYDTLAPIDPACTAKNPHKT